MKKTYYSPTKPNSRVYRPHLFFKTATAVGSLFIRPKVVFSEPLPENEPVIFMANHAEAYGPSSLLYALRKKRKFRSWSHADILYVKTAPNHIMLKIFTNAGIFRPICRVFSYIMAPAMAGMFKSTGVIPVYRDVRIKTTFSKSFETLGDGMDVVIFPESIVPNPENPYLDTMQRGAFKFIGLCKKYTGSVPKIYPTYCCKSLKTVLIGAPLTFDETIPTADAEEKLKSELNEAVKALAETLPKHKPTHYSYLPKNIDVLKKYMGIHEEEVYEMLRTYYATQTQLKVES